MRLVIVGMGVQGCKRLRVAGPDAVGAVDPAVSDANFRNIREMPLDRFDAAAVCLPDGSKFEIVDYLIERGKHVLVEKPLLAGSEQDLRRLEANAHKAGVVCYTAYNHRFEPHFVRMRDLLKSGELGEIYRCRMFYGNGTARLVRESNWRDTEAGVLTDLGSHLLDTARFWFGDVGGKFRVISASCFENRAPDHVVIASTDSSPQLEFEMTLLSWRNHFSCDVFAENGSAHIESLCKWGAATFTRRSRVLPSGRPPEEALSLVQDDPTWELEYAHFKSLCADRRPTSLANDIWLLNTLSSLSDETKRVAARL